MRVLCVGLSYKTAAVDLRERLAFDNVTAGRALRQLTDRWSTAEFAILSTCNRVEVYMARPVHGHPRADELRRWLGTFHNLPAETCEGSLYTLADAQAVEHLLAVAGGLDSLVPGEVEIVAQVKGALAQARDAGVARAALGDIFQASLHTAKHIRSQTAFSEGKVSVASVAIDAATAMVPDLSQATVLSIGAGKMNRQMLQRLAELGAGKLMVSNRSQAKAQQLASLCGGQVAALADLREYLPQADVVLCSTASEAPLLTREMLKEAITRRHGRDMLLIDIAVPRDVQPSVGELPGVHLRNIDDLESVVRSTIRMRSKERDSAQAIIDAHVPEVLASLHLRTVSPTIDALYRQMESIAAEEFEEAGKRLAGGSQQTPAETLQRALHRTIRRTLHPVTEALRNAEKSETARADAAALRRLFQLPDEP